MLDESMEFKKNNIWIEAHVEPEMTKRKNPKKPNPLLKDYVLQTQE